MKGSESGVRKRYDATARYYDMALKLYALAGINQKLRKKAVSLLQLQRGDHVVELGCGTGVNFSLILESIGPEGRLTGVDISPNMLDIAQRRVVHAGWRNVELVHQDIVEYRYPGEVNGVISVGVLGYIDDCDRLIESASQAIVSGGRFVVLDGKLPDRMPGWLFDLFIRVSRPFGVTRDYFEKWTWKLVERYFGETTFESLYGGMLFLSSGRAPGKKEKRTKR